MRHMALTAAFALATALALPAHAGWYVNVHGTSDDLELEEQRWPRRGAVVQRRQGHPRS